MFTWKKVEKYVPAVALFWLVASVALVLLWIYLVRKPMPAPKPAPKQDKVETFTSEVDGPVLQLFLVDWCKFCKKFKPEAKEIAAMKGLPFDVEEIDGDEESSEDLKKAGVSGFPTVQLVMPGGKRHTYSGERTADDIVEWAKGLVGEKKASSEEDEPTEEDEE